MKIDTAIKLLLDYIGTGPDAEPVAFDNAVALGAEALKRLKENREYAPPQIPRPLPGETPE